MNDAVTLRVDVSALRTNGHTKGVNRNTPKEELGIPDTSGVNGQVNGESEAMDVPLRPEEKRRLNWENGLYLAPLTTVGNLVSFSISSPSNPLIFVSHFDDYA